MSEKAICELCGDPMPEGEEMFKYHGYSGPCPKPATPVAPGTDYLLSMARECFLNMLAEARRWDVDYDGDEVNGRAVSYVTHFIEVDGFAFDQLAEALGIKPAFMQTMEDTVRRAIAEPPSTDPRP